MKICVIGAGSIGGFVGVKLALTGAAVTLIARGPNLQAIRRHGMRLMQGGLEYVAGSVKATSSLGEAGPQDVVILAMKAHQVLPVVAELPMLLHDRTVIIPMQNGIPWWYFQRPRPNQDFSGREARYVESVDPGGAIAKAIEPERLIGCVVYPACELAAPGVVRHIEGERFPLGELDGTATPRVKQLASLFESAGFKAPVLEDIRAEIWLKLWGNLTFNPLSALTHSTLVDICRFPLARELAVNMMREAEAVANRLGIQFRLSLERRISGAERVGKHKTSMLQDVEAGRAPEIDALVGAVIELGKVVGVPTPHIETVYALMKLLGRTMQEEKVCIRAHPFPG